MGGGSTGDATLNPVGTGVLTLYQADYDKDWGGGTPRIAGLDNGLDNPAGLWQTLFGGILESYAKNITMVQRVTRDEEDIIVVGGSDGLGPFLYGISGLTT
jgi:hypothetical protein